MNNLDLCTLPCLTCLLFPVVVPSNLISTSYVVPPAVQNTLAPAMALAATTLQTLQLTGMFQALDFTWAHRTSHLSCAVDDHGGHCHHCVAVGCRPCHCLL